MVERYRLPKKIGPSPAEGEPGLQNSASRIRSSREADRQSLQAARSDQTEAASVPHAEGMASLPPGTNDKDGVPAGGHGRGGAGGGGGSSGKVKVSILFRMPKSDLDRVEQAATARGLETDYLLRALAKTARAEIRNMREVRVLDPLIPSAKAVFDLSVRDLSLGEPMTIYLANQILQSMHASLGDPLQIEPKASVVNAYVVVLVSRALAARNG